MTRIRLARHHGSEVRGKDGPSISGRTDRGFNPTLAVVVPELQKRRRAGWRAEGNISNDAAELEARVGGEVLRRAAATR